MLQQALTPQNNTAGIFLTLEFTLQPGMRFLMIIILLKFISSHLFSLYIPFALHPQREVVLLYKETGHRHCYRQAELRSCVKVKVATLGSPSLIVLVVFFHVKR